jgi:choline dehydrogenase-like flavoprotein
VTVVEAGPHVDRSAALKRFKQSAVRVPEAPYEAGPHAESPATVQDTYIRQDGPDLFRSTYLRVVGGTTWHWLGTALRLLPSDLELQSRYGVGADWPLDYSDLATWYDVAEFELGVSGHNDDMPGPPRQKPYPMPGLPATLGDRLMEQVAGRFGFKVRVLPQARNSQPFDGRPACCASSSCIPICPVQAKYDATVHLRKAETASARILSDSVAVRVDVGPDGRVSGILIRRPDRSETWLGTRHLVIAANAIEGPKLLLMSRSDRFPNGVANSSDAVGRYLMDHPVQLTRALSPVPVWQRRGPQEVSAIHEMRDGNHRRQHAAFVTNVGNQGWEWAGPNLATLARGFVDAGLSGPELLNAVRSHSSREMTLVALTEQLPHLENRITPDFNRLDTIGVPKPRIFFRLDDYTATALAAARKIHEQLFLAVGD